MAICLFVSIVSEWRGKLPTSDQKINLHETAAETLEYAAEMIDTGIVEFVSSALIGAVFLTWGFNYHDARKWMESYVVRVTGENRFMEDKMTKDERVMALCMAAAVCEREGR